MANLEIIGFPQSTYVRVARMACEEKGVAVRPAAGSAAFPRGARDSSVRENPGDASR